MSNVPSNPVDQKAIRAALQEMADSFARADSEKALRKEIVEAIVEKFEIDKKLFNKMAKTFYKDSFSNEVGEASEFEVAYETIVQMTTPPDGENDENE
jgi:hypothetical protein